MLRRDGSVEFYLIEHQDSQGWHLSALDHFLFEDMSDADKRGPLGAYYRELLKPQDASSSLWQRYSVHGYTEREDAELMLEALARKRPSQPFRMVKRRVEQHTEIVKLGMP